MSNLSFTNFALAAGFKVPLSTLAIARSLGMTAPPAVSMRAMIATAEPFEPADPFYAVTSAGDANFAWWDRADPPLFVTLPADPLRAATLFEFKLWTSSDAGTTVIQDAILPASGAVRLTTGSMLYGAGPLDGSYTYQITAINQFGTASTSVLAAHFNPPAVTPIISVTRVGTNIFRVEGSEFTSLAGQSMQVNADPGITSIPVTHVAVTIPSSGSFAVDVNTASLCALATSGAPINFYVSVPDSVTVVSNIVTGNSCP
jgi:hypothetical protein